MNSPVAPIFPARRTPPIYLPKGPVAWKPVPLKSANLGQVSGETVKAVLTGAVLIPTAIAAATAYVGFRLGSKDKGLPSALGYVVGVIGALTALSGLLIALGVIQTPIPIIGTEPPKPFIPTPPSQQLTQPLERI